MSFGKLCPAARMCMPPGRWLATWPEDEFESRMKITKLTTYIVPPRWLFLKIETDEGIIGWGEPVVEGRALTVQAAVHELEDYLIGKDPFLIEDHWQVMYRAGFYRGGAVHMSAIAGIDQALWDIKGKALGQPIHSLLGGQVRDRIKVYSWIGGDRPSDVAQNAKDVVARGFKAIKLNGSEEMQIVDTNEKVDKAIETIAIIREAVGPHIGIGVDFHGRIHKPMAKVMAKELEQFKLMFIEEPVLSENRETLKEIANHCSTPIALGERLYSRWDFKQVLSDGYVDILQPDLSHAAALPNAARSRRWRKLMTWRWRPIAHSVRSRLQPACRSMRSATTPLSRNRASASITTRATISSTTSPTRKCSTTPTASSRSRRVRARHRSGRAIRHRARQGRPSLAQPGLAPRRRQRRRVVKLLAA